ncbi:MAG: DUF4157 domain-containing protein [Acidobacteria bacterium]|nr:DUF4157 domain-containing protein [Acidobacteriota bacterium]
MTPTTDQINAVEQHETRAKNVESVSTPGSAGMGALLGGTFGGALGSPPSDGGKLLSDRTISLSSNAAVRSAVFRQAQRSQGNHFVQRAISRAIEQKAPAEADAVNAQADVIPTGGGEPLAEQPREFMESRFGHDFADVRIHTDGGAATAAEALNANAFTSGRDIYFGQGKYQPESKDGQRLLAHELTHTIQQTNGPSSATPASASGELTVSSPEDALEKESEQAADAVMSDRTPTVPRNVGAAPVQRSTLVQRDARNVFAGKSYDLKTNKGVLQMAQDWQVQLWEDWSSFPVNSKERNKAGRAMAIYMEHYLPRFEEAARQGAAPGFLTQQVMAAVNDSIAGGETEATSKKYIDVRSYRTWFPEHYAAEYFDEANRLRQEGRADFAYFEKAKLDYLYEREKYTSFAAVQYVDHFAADMLDEQGLKILAGQWPDLPFREHRLFIRLDAMDKAEVIAKQEWFEAIGKMDAKLVKSGQREKRYAEIVQKLAQFVKLKQGLLTGTTPPEQARWIDGRIEDLVTELREEFGVLLDRARLFEFVTAGADLRKVTGRIEVSPEGKLYLGKRLTFRAQLDYLPPGRQARLAWRWVTGGREAKFLMEKPAHVVGKAPLAEPLELVPPFWVTGPYKYEIGRHGGMEVAAYVYLGEDDQPATRLSSGWLAMPEEVPAKIEVTGAPKEAVRGAPVQFGMGPWIPESSNYKAQWFVDGKHINDFWVFKYSFQTAGPHEVAVKLRRYDTDFFGDTDYGIFSESLPVKINVIEPTQYGESVLAKLDNPLVEGLSDKSLTDVAKSTESSIHALERKAAMEEDGSYWKDRVETQRERLRKINEYVPDLAQAEKLPEDELNLEQGRTYSGPVPAVLIHPEKNMTVPLAMYMVVKHTTGGWQAQLIDATGKILRFTGSGSTTQDAYLSAFKSWSSDNEYPIGGQVVYRFDPVVFPGSGQPERRSFSTTTSWKKAKDWWDKATAVAGLILGGLLLAAPEATITKALALALLAAVTARGAIAVAEKLEIGYDINDKEILLEGISIAASVTGVGGTLMRTIGRGVGRPLITQVGSALIITSTATDIGTFVYATADAIRMLRAIDDDPTLDDAQKQVEILRVMTGLFANSLLQIVSNKDLIKGKPRIKTQLESGEKIKLDTSARVDMELELRATGEHETFLKRTQGMDAEARDRVLVEWVIDARARRALKPTPENVRRVTDPKYAADYDAEITVADHTYRRMKKNGKWCRFTEPVCGIDLANINSDVDVILTQKTAAPGEPDVIPSLEDVTTHPGPQLAPATPGGPARALPPGMGEHKAARRKEYEDAGGTWPIERWNELYDRRMKARQAELEQQVKDLTAQKETLEKNLNESLQKAKTAKDEANRIAGEARIAKGNAKTQLNAQAQQARAASEQAAKQADATRQPVVDTQIQIQRLQSQLNVDAGTRLPCFAAGTTVWTPDGPRPIEELRVNDAVLACDLKNFSIVEARVVETYRNQTTKFYHVAVGGQIICTTSLHRFWVQSEREWIDAQNLTAGMELWTTAGNPAPINSIEIHEAPGAATYNLQVDKTPTYFVGPGVLVHNNGAPSYGFGNLRIYLGVNPNFPGSVYVGQTDDIARRQKEHREEAIEMLKKPNLTLEQRQFWEFKRDLELTERVSGLNQDQANYLEQKNITLQRDTAKAGAYEEGDEVKHGKTMNRREQVSAKKMPALEKKIMADPKVKAAGVCP